jgi:DNA polymerase-3 subunit gamma/tau
LSEEGNFWTETVRSLIAAESINALVRELALQSQLIGRDTGQWQLRIESESLNQGTARERLQTALQSLGHEVKLVVEIGKVTDSPAMRNAAALLEKQKAAEELIQSDPLVQNMIQEFGAKIVPGSIKLISSH